MTHLMTKVPDTRSVRLSRVDDEALVRAATAGDVAAQERLWREHVDAVFRVCASMLPAHDAEDATAECFLTSFARGASFDAARGSVRAWLLGIAVNQVRRRWRADRRAAATLDRIRGRRDAVVVDDHADDVIARSDGSSVRAALALLTDSERLVLVTQAAGDLTPDELARALGCHAGAAKVRLHRARRRLAVILDPTSSGSFHHA